MLVLQESRFLFVFLRTAWHAPFTGSENTPTVSWCFREASKVNLIVAYILWIRVEMNSGALITLSVFYHLGLLNTMDDDACCSFDLPDNKFL